MQSHPRVSVTIDCADLERTAAFWERSLGYERRRSDADSPYVTIVRPAGADGPPHITFQRVPEPKTGKARLHLDLFVDNGADLTEQMLKDGAELVSRQEAGEWTTRILRDPAGIEFCVIGPD